MENFQIENLVVESLSDRPEWTAVVGQWLYEEFHHVDDRYTTAEATTATLTAPYKWSVLVASYNGVPVGTAAFVQTDMSSRPELEGWFADLFVVPEARHEGIGSHLLQEVAEWARKHTTREEIYLFTETGQAFYEKRGWAAKEHTTFLGEEITIMQMRLR